MSSPYPGLLRLMEALAADRSPTQADLDVLNRLAARAIGAEHEDAVADFIVSTLRATRAGRSASAQRILALPERELLAVVRYRLRQHALRARPGWPLLKALRAHVARSLKCPPAQPPPEPPSTLLRHGRLCGVLVDQATSYVLATSPDVERTPAAIAARLKATFFYVPTDTETDRLGGEQDVHHDHEARALAVGFRKALPPDLLRVASARYRGLRLAVIARSENISVSTAHARVGAAVDRLRAHAESVAANPDTGRAALTLLAC